MIYHFPHSAKPIVSYTSLHFRKKSSMVLDTGRFRIKDYESYFGRTRGVGELEVIERKDDYQTNFTRGMLFTEPRPTLQITFFERYART